MTSNKKWPNQKLKCASQAEILRSHQRDDDFVKQLREKFIEILQNFGIQRTLFQSDIPLKLLYFIFTSGMGNQTLGEEYTGIVQANLEERKVPTLTVRILAAILECFGEKALLNLLTRLQARVNHPHSELTPRAIVLLDILLSKLRTMIPIIILFHKGIFYIYGRYYSLSKRIAGLDYAKVYGHRPVDAISWGLRLLGVATLVQCILRTWQSSKIQDKSSADMCNEKYSGYNCRLCLEAPATTATICGHLFCWNCLSEWLRVKPQCPFCRDHVPPSRIVHLMNL